MSYSQNSEIQPQVLYKEYAIPFGNQNQNDFIISADEANISSMKAMTWLIKRIPIFVTKFYLAHIVDTILLRKNHTVYKLQSDSVAYPSFRPMTLLELYSLNTDTLFHSFQKAYPPYDSVDSIVICKDPIFPLVCQIRFIEKWTYPSLYQPAIKHIVAFAPVMDRYYNNILHPQLKTLYWVKID